ncbi:NAD(P)-dependent oxidoreductase [Marinicrinis lubricantis]|uniref:NAD(P)-dependent oxidoreductase n=1 Tax=Marinicrinis lubricantis TaxID=2086470 RepID=A0ABW1IS14_9BACL
MKIVVLGPGLMGESMARLYLRAGHEIAVLQHRNAEPVDRLVSEGAARIEDLVQAGTDADIVFCMLPNLPEIEDLLFHQGLSEALRSGSLFLNMSTVSPEGIQSVAERLGEKGIDVLDAPVSGGTAKAASGTLAVMAGGQRQVYERYLPILSIVGENIFYTGPVGTGQVIKLCNNLLAAMIMTANAEVLAMGAKAGADAELIREIVLQSTGCNRILADWIPRTILQGAYTPGFTLRLMQKDVDLAMQLGHSTGTPLFLGALTKQLLRMAEGASGGNAELDFSVIAKLYQDVVDVDLAEKKSPVEAI